MFENTKNHPTYLRKNCPLMVFSECPIYGTELDTVFKTYTILGIIIRIEDEKDHTSYPFSKTTFVELDPYTEPAWHHIVMDFAFHLSMGEPSKSGLIDYLEDEKYAFGGKYPNQPLSIEVEIITDQQDQLKGFALEVDNDET